MSILAETHRTPSLSDAPHNSSTRTRKRKSRNNTRTNSDEELVVAAQGGDATAYGALYERYQPYIWKMLNDDVSDVEARSDLMQAVFEKGWTKLGHLRDPNAFRPWLAQLGRRLIIDHYRASSRTVATDFTDPSQEFDLVDEDWSADDWVAMRELASALQVGIDGLAPRDATVLELATSFGFTSHEIAAALDIQVSHARVLLHRARQRLSKELSATYQSGT